jgi:hypothetical protein
MSSEHFERNIHLAGQAEAELPHSENMDAETERAGRNRERNGGREEEFLVKWQMPGNHDSIAVKRLLNQVLSELLMCYPTEITLIDRKQREWTFHENEDVEKFPKECEKAAIQLHSIKNKDQRVVRWVAVTKIRPTRGIQEWKDNDQFYPLAQEKKIYMFPHPFGHDDWDIVSVGFIKDIHAIHYPREHLHAQILQMIEKQNKKSKVIFIYLPFFFFCVCVG